MKYYSTCLKKMFDSESDLIEAEEKYNSELKAKEEERQARMAQRKEDASNIEEAYNEMIHAKKKYYKLVDEFIKKYNSYHFTISNSEDIVEEMLDAFYRAF